jgi:titin
VTESGDVTARSLRVDGLTNGTQYSCSVVATNGAGDGAAVVKAATPRTTPDAPTGVAADPGKASATVSWTAPAWNGGSPVTGFTATCVSDTVGKSANAAASATSVTVGGLVNGTTYACTVAAKNAAGTGPTSVPVSVTPRSVPGAPMSVTAVAGPQRATISFTPPGSDGGDPITSYAATCTSTSAGATTPVASSGPGSPVVVDGLTSGAPYQCSVTATNAAGTGPPSSSRSVTPQ